MNQDQKKSRFMVILIFAMAVIPFMTAWLLKGDPVFIEGRVNKGELIEPVISTSRDDLTGIDLFSKDNIKELHGHWIMLNLVSGEDCQQACLDAIYKTKQLLLMMNKDLTRMRRAVLFLKPDNPDRARALLADDRIILKVSPSEGLAQKILNLRNGQDNDGILLLMDPMGNIMMQYPSGFDPYKVKSDLSHLLRISQIG